MLPDSLSSVSFTDCLINRRCCSTSISSCTPSNASSYVNAPLRLSLIRLFASQTGEPRVDLLLSDDHNQTFSVCLRSRLAALLTLVSVPPFPEARHKRSRHLSGWMWISCGYEMSAKLWSSMVTFNFQASLVFSLFFVKPRFSFINVASFVYMENKCKHLGVVF